MEYILLACGQHGGRAEEGKGNKHNPKKRVKENLNRN